MRIIAGSCKGRSLQAVPGRATRPTTDKVKEAMFNMIGPYFSGGRALDLFAGSGALGIEALSRGVEEAIFVDKSQRAVKTIHSNIHKCQYIKRAEVYRNDATRALYALARRQLLCSLIFLDPPYEKEALTSQIEIISEHRMLTHDGVLVVEHLESLQLPEVIGSLNLVRREVYGDITAISLYQYRSEG